MQDFVKEAKTSFCFTHATNELSRYLKPFLDAHRIKNFYYVRISRKGECVYLTNQLEYAFDYWEAALPLRTAFSEAYNEQLSYSVNWEGVIDKDIIEFAAAHSCFNGFSIIDRSYERIQFVSCLTAGPSVRVIAEPLLRAQVRQFEYAHRRLIKQAAKSPLKLPENYLQPEVAAFYPKRSSPVSYRGIQASLSFRQLDCLCLYSHGFTCQHIGDLLSLSPRTVETHLEAIKSRFGLTTRDELAAFAYSTPLIQSYCPRLS